MSQWYYFVTPFLDIYVSVYTKFIGSTYTLLFPLKSNTLCIKLGSSYGNFLKVELLVILIFCTNNCWDLETTPTYGNVLLIVVLLIPNLLYFDAGILNLVPFKPKFRL